MGLYRKIFGSRGEAEAERFLKKNGYKIIGRNYRTRHGEIDLIAREGDTVVFVEVKTRSNSSFGHPSTGVDLRKQKHMVLASTQYLAEHGLTESPARFDVVCIETKDGGLKAELIKDAFEAE